MAHFEQLARCQVTIEVSGVVEPDEMPAVVGAWRGKAGDSNWAGDTVRAAPSTYTTDSRLLEPFHAVGTTGFFWAASSPSLLVGEVACDGPFEPLARKAGATTVHSMASGVATPGVLGTGVATFHEEREGEHLVSFHGPIGRTTMRHADGELVYDLPSNPKLTGIYRGPITIEMAGAAAGHIVIADPQDVDRLPNESMLSRREPGPPAA